MDELMPESFHRQFADAFNSGDVQPLVDLYEPGASLIPEPGEVVSGHAAIAGALGRYQAIGTMTAETRYCVQSGDLALASASWWIRGIGPNGEPTEVRGVSADLLRRQADGRWLLVVDHPFGASEAGEP
jgi:ketosteroid isomerase-like protein